jgi:hypothetical protein
MSYPALPEGWTFFVLDRTARVDLVSGFYPLPDNLRRLPALDINARDRSLTRVSRLTGEVFFFLRFYALPGHTLCAWLS